MVTINGIPQKDYLLCLIKEAVSRAAKLGEAYKSDLDGDFLQAQKNLEIFSEVNAQQTLLLSAARINITQVEKKTIALIIGDRPITGQQMTHLVRIRLICTEILNLLSAIMEGLKQTFHGKDVVFSESGKHK
jgi:hypothetical protein